MAILKRLNASTLIETLVATVLIVIVFMMASLLLNSIFSNSIKGNHQELNTHLQKLAYQNTNGLIKVPYFEEFDQWNIELGIEDHKTATYLVSKATNRKTKKVIIKYSNFAQ